MDSSHEHNINDTVEEPLNNKGGGHGVNQDQLEPTNTLEEPLNNKGGSDEVKQEEGEPMMLSLFPLAPDLRPGEISEENSIIVAPPGIPNAGQSSTEAAENPPLIVENLPARLPPPRGNRDPDMGRLTCRGARYARLGQPACRDCRKANAFSLRRNPR